MSTPSSNDLRDDPRAPPRLHARLLLPAHRPAAHDFHHSLNGGRNLDNLGQVDVLDRVLHTNKEFLKSWQYTVHKGYTTPDYPVDKALATTEKPLPA